MDKDKSHFRVGSRIYYGENYIDIPAGATNPCTCGAQQVGGATMFEVFEVTVNGKVHRFAFDPETDDLADGPTLIGVRYVGSTDIHQLAPSRHAEPAAWDAAESHYGWVTPAHTTKEHTMKMKDFEVTINGKVHRFAFDPDTDNPADGATLTGLRRVDSTDIHQLAPSRHAEPAAWDAANKHYGI